MSDRPPASSDRSRAPDHPPTADPHLVGNGRGRAWVQPMIARDLAPTHRPSTNLELLFDLTFVVAVSQVATQLAEALVAGHLHQGVQGYLSVFFAIWWAWMNFTWFASAFDTDDVPYRVLTLLQMVGVLVLAAGVPDAFQRADFVGVTVGYVIMRVAMVGQWLRAGLSDPASRRTCLRYAAGVSLVQAGWVARLALPGAWATPSFVILVVVELATPLWAERIWSAPQGRTSWHPEHIVERYGLFTIIVLGEGIAQISRAFQAAFSADGISAGLLVTAGTGLVLLFALWWLYFTRPTASGLREHRDRSFLWGYGHLLVFAALAAVAAGLEVAIEAQRSGPGHHEVQLSHLAIALSMAVPVSVFLFVYGALVAGINDDHQPALAHIGAGAVATMVLAAAAPVVPLPVALALITLPSVGLIVDAVVGSHRLAVSAA